MHGPAVPMSRRGSRRRSRLVGEHERRKGDLVLGGGSLALFMTAYRQRAVLCATAMVKRPKRLRDLKGVASNAAKILLRNVYGWFERVERGWRCGLAGAGRTALARSD